MCLKKSHNTKRISLKYNNLVQYISEIQRVEKIINTTDSYKLKNDMEKYLKRLKKEYNELNKKVYNRNRIVYAYMDEVEEEKSERYKRKN